MRKISVFVVLAAVVWMLASGATAYAQVPGGQCNGPGSMTADISLDPQSGPPGTVTTLSGIFRVVRILDEGGNGNVIQSTVQEGQPVQAWWLETGLGDGQAVGDLPVTVDPDLVIRFGGNITVPLSAQPGPHEIALLSQGDTDPACVAFTVTESVRQDAYQQASVTLPVTGAGALIPAAGLAAIAVGAVFLTRRRRADRLL